jgi:hypothetical protein
MKLCASRCHAKLGPARVESWIKERPAQRQEHQLRIGPAEGGFPVCIVKEPHAIFRGQGFEPFADEANPHVDLVEPG